VSLRDQILDADDQESEVVAVPEWGGVKVEVRSSSVADRGRMVAISMSDDEGDDDHRYERMQAAVLVACCYDPETGDRLFQQGDYDRLLGKNAKAVERLTSVGMRLCGLSSETEDELGKD
jgi:hypothetical protein